MKSNKKKLIERREARNKQQAEDKHRMATLERNINTLLKHYYIAQYGEENVKFINRFFGTVVGVNSAVDDREPEATDTIDTTAMVLGPLYEFDDEVNFDTLVDRIAQDDLGEYTAELATYYKLMGCDS